MNERDIRISRRAAVGAALVAVPLAGMQLYLKHQRSADIPRPVADDSIDEALAHLRRVDSSLIGYRQIAKIDTQLTKPRAFCLGGDGSIAVAANDLVRLIRDGVMRDIPLSGTPNCLAIDDERIFVGFREHVELYDFSGTRKAIWPALPAGALLTGIAVGANDIFLADSGRRVVLHTDSSGKMLHEIGQADQGRGVSGILLPSPHLHVAIAADGTVWLNNPGRHRLENFTPEGNLERFWGLSGINVEAFIGCCNPIDFALLKDGSFITVEKGVARVKRYLTDGRFDSFIAAPAAFAEYAAGLGVVASPDGRVFILDRIAGVIHEFERTVRGAS